MSRTDAERIADALDHLATLRRHASRPELEAELLGETRDTGTGAS